MKEGGVRALTHGGVDHAFEVVGRPETVTQAARSLAKGGTAYLVGIHKPGATSDLELDGDYMVNQSALRGVHMGFANFKLDVPLYADLYLQGRLNLDDMISRRGRLEDVNEAFRAMKAGEVSRTVLMFE